ncbi:MAG: family 31 glucosidase [Clostridia bacterium]|nr:family 31 glucosidase [Clostridia bacterium]
MFRNDENALYWRYGREELRIEPWGKDALRVRATLTAWPKDEDWALLPPASTDAEIHIAEDLASITNGNITAVCTAAGHLTFKDKSGKVLLREYVQKHPIPEQRGREWCAHMNGNAKLKVRFETDPDERLYGMGEYQHPLLNLKGTTLDLAQLNTQASIPFMLSSNGYGFLWNNPAVGEANLGRNLTVFQANSTPAMDYWICTGNTPREILHKYADAVGKVPEFPEYALDLVQSRLRYRTQEEVLEVAREYKRRGLKLGTIVIDFHYWGAGKLGTYDFLPELWPDPDAMIRELSEMGVRVMTSFWPNMESGGDNYFEFKEKGLFVMLNRGDDAGQYDFPTSFVDMTNPEARQLVWEKHRPGHFDRGIRNYFIDAAEPDFHVISRDMLRFKIGPGEAVANIYPFCYAKLFGENIAKEGITPFNIIRCAWAGSQRFGAMLWSGDVFSTFEAFRDQICIAMNVGLAGQPWFTTDIGGFHGANISDPRFHELLCRWFQFGVFSPVLRMHGCREPSYPAEDGIWAGAPNELWSYGDEVYEILKKYLDIRESLKPYLRHVMEEAHLYGDPAIRAMFYEFPDDANCWDLREQYMLGSELIVAPVLYEGAKTTRIYLPEGCSWVDVWTKETHEGGRWVERETPIDLIPVYARAGSDALNCF